MVPWAAGERRQLESFLKGRGRLRADAGVCLTLVRNTSTYTTDSPRHSGFISPVVPMTVQVSVWLRHIILASGKRREAGAPS